MLQKCKSRRCKSEIRPYYIKTNKEKIISKRWQKGEKHVLSHFWKLNGSYMYL